MDDPQDSSRADTAATRKRRSSILKNQRPPRTPFSEVEFNVATPTDTTKSRRVSFSRKTGVAEFVTNEATTTWKIFYEEHNKSLESSGHNDVAIAPRQTIDHIGKRIFDQQFEEVEVVEFNDTAQANPLRQFEASFNNINLTQQFASLECMTDDLKFTVPQTKFEQSALTELSKPFGNEINVPLMEDMTNPISMNFSALPNTSSSDKCDDLDEIEKDLERSEPSGLCPGPMRGGKDFSEFMEVVDFNVTHGVIHYDASEMSITDTIDSSKVHEDSRLEASVQKLKLSKLDDDWTNDKENIIMHPYIEPKESLNFKVNDASDEVLVFDGKRLTTQPITSKIPDKENFRQTLLPNAPVNPPQRKTIILDINDDLPNFVKSNSSESNYLKNNYQPAVFNNVNMSITTAIDNQIKVSKNTNITNNTLTNDFCNASNVNEKNETVKQNEISNISLTQAIPSNIISTSEDTEKQNNCHVLNKSRNNTIHYDDIIQDISITQAIPNNIIHVSEAKEFTTNKKIIFNSDSCDMSMTKALPTNICFNKIENDHPSCSNVQPNFANENSKNLIHKDKRTTIIFKNDACDISMTQILPTNINVQSLEIKNDNQIDKKKSINESSTGVIPAEKRKTIIFDNDSFNMSITQALPTNINLITNKSSKPITENLVESTTEKRKTIIFNNDSSDLSMTQILPTNMNVIKEKTEEKRRTIIFDDNSCDISMTQILPTNININKENTETKQRTIIFDSNSCDISITQILPTNINVNKENTEAKQRTIIFDNNSCDISMTQILPTNINVNKENTEAKQRTIIFDNNSCDISMTQILPTNININKERTEEKRKTIIFENESCDMSVTQVIPVNIYLNTNNEHANKNVPIAESNITEQQNTVLESELADVSSTSFKAYSSQDSNQKAKDCLNISNSIQPAHSSSLINGINKSLVQRTALDNLNITIDNKHSVTHPIPSNIIDMQKDLTFNLKADGEISKSEEIEVHEISAGEEKKNILVYQVNTNLQTKEERDEINVNDIVKKEVSQLIHNVIGTTSSNIQDNDSINNCEDKPCIEAVVSSAEKALKENLYKAESRCNPSKSKKSILNELLDMSCESINYDSSEMEQNDDITNEALQTDYEMREVTLRSMLREQLTESNANDSFAVIKEIDNGYKTSDDSLVEITKNNNSVICMENESNEYKTLLKGTSEVYDVRVPRLTQENTDVQEIEDVNSEYKSESDKSVILLSEQLTNLKESKSFRNANNTTELLKMLSDFTDGDESVSGEKHNITEDLCKEKTNEPTELTDNNMVCESKNNIPEHKRLSLAPRRQSIALSREDLLNNISLALQQSRFEVDETDNMDDTSESINMLEPNDSHKSNRMSSDVVKTLQFEDESASDTSIKSERKISPLKKTAFGETTFINEGKKVQVIPAQLQDIQDGIKELMHDLVKPYSDVPFDNVLGVKQSPSTCSEEVQANIMASSQIDMSVELLSNNASICNVKEYENIATDAKSSNNASICNVKEYKNIATDAKSLYNLQDHKNDVKSSKISNEVEHIETNYENHVVTKPLCIKQNIPEPVLVFNPVEHIETNYEDHVVTKALCLKQNIPEPVLVFNPENPLKNIFLPSMNLSDAREYNDTRNVIEHSHEVKTNDEKVKQSLQYHTELKPNIQWLDNKNLRDKLEKSILIVEHQNSIQVNMEIVDNTCEKSSSTSNISDISKPLAVDRSVEGITTDARNTEVNTVIKMKENKELLQERSSLTLVDQGVTDSERKIDIQCVSDKTNCSLPPVRVIFKSENENVCSEKDSVVTTYDELSGFNHAESKHTQKRSYSPTKLDSFTSNLEVTPKPISKMQKKSNTSLPTSTNTSLSEELSKYISEGNAITHEECNINNSITRTEIVQNVNVEYQFGKLQNISIKVSETSSLDTEKTSATDVKSVDSISTVSLMPDPSITISQVMSNVASQISDISAERIFKTIEKQSYSNIVENIKELSFMGTAECQWDCSGPPGTWWFQLMGGRLGLRMRLGRDCVQAHAPLDIDVEVLRIDESDPLAALCVDLTAEAMRYESSRLAQAGSVRAGDAALLLRRCVALARMARRWATVMRDAKMRLAYDVLPGGVISLNVVNFPLRCVWEMRMRVSVEVGSERASAYPRALDVSVAPPVPPPAALRRLVASQPLDWGHAPRTLWKVFRYLKNRKRDQDLLGI